MKALSMLLIAVLVFSSVPVFACGGSCGSGDKDKDDKVITQDTQYLCGGGDKAEPDAMCSSCGCKKDKKCDKPKPESEATNLCGGSCGTDKNKDKDA